MNKVFVLAVLMAVFIITGCGGAAVNYRPMAGYEAVNKHWCAVKDTFFTPDENSSAADYGVKTLFFCCSECADAFEANPVKYAGAIKVDDGKDHSSHKSNGGHGGGHGSGGGAGSGGGGGGSCH